MSPMCVEIDVAENVPHALELMTAGDPQIRPVAGATDVVLKFQSGRLKARRFVSIADLRELSFVQPETDCFRLGAGTLVADVIRHREFGVEFPCAVMAAHQFASPQIRNRATVGGNIGNASPAADMVPPLIALGAHAIMASARRGARELAIEDLFLGFGKTAIAPDELITELRVPRHQYDFQAFAKFGNRAANVIATVNMAMCLKLSGETVCEARVAYGSVAPRPLRSMKVEQFLVGQRLSATLISDVAEAVLADISPIDDVRGSRQYKQTLAVNATQDALSRALAKAHQ